ncbi:MAG: hypothetical protein ACFFAN_15360 [Promethearchaeota archaeon]
MSGNKKSQDEDFISMLKKMKADTEKPSAIRETLDKLEKLEEKMKSLEKENIELKETIKKDIELISKSEKQLKKDLDEKEKLKKDYESLKLKLNKGIDSKGLDPSTDLEVNNVLIENLQSQLSIKNTQISEFEKKIKALEYKIEELIQEKEAAKLKLDGTATLEQKPKIQAVPVSDSTTNLALIENLASELSKKKTQILELTNKIELFESEIKELTLEKEFLKKKLSEKQIINSTGHLNSVRPIDKLPGTQESIQSSPKTLEILIQDLQSDLNKYKRFTEILKQENETLKKTLEAGGAVEEPRDIKKLKKENKSLRKELSNLKKLYDKTSIEIRNAEGAEKKVKEFQDKLKKQEEMITKLKSSKTAEVPVPSSGPMSGLIEDLQNKINKLKIEIKEKNLKIEEIDKK